ncbi:MAG: hydroxymethylglutaryl-CoA synthase family protein, partial [Gammaproteobacteria bacterium]|nr:hydroxymethylglutaryl-CoA synthase family protein [Gammaproteobacteria bacterium]
FYGPRCYVDMAELAEARGVDPDKYLLGLGQRQMAVATPCEDTVTMASVAGWRALEQFDIDPAEIGTLIVGTETGIDHSKPAAVYVHEMLGLGENCRTFETKHACYGAMAGLTSTMDWIHAGRARGRKALVIASDIARYGIDTAGEPTQGAGAVAMVVGDSPRLLELDPTTFGDYTRQVMDFWRPLYSKYAFADGHYSIDCYLDAFTGAWRDACEQAGGRDAFSLDNLDACFYHVPFVKMARKAHHRHCETEWGQSIAREDQLATRVRESYDTQVAPWLELNSVVGNIYTGSLFLAIADYLRKLDNAREGGRISLFSYGSGCGAAFGTATVVEGAGNWRQQVDPQPHLDQRHKLDIPAYEQLIRAADSADHNDAPYPEPSQWDLGEGLYYVGTRDHIRHYSGNPANAT